MVLCCVWMRSQNSGTCCTDRTVYRVVFTAWLSGCDGGILFAGVTTNLSMKHRGRRESSLLRVSSTICNRNKSPSACTVFSLKYEWMNCGRATKIGTTHQCWMRQGKESERNVYEGQNRTTTARYKLLVYLQVLFYECHFCMINATVSFLGCGPYRRAWGASTTIIPSGKLSQTYIHSLNLLYRSYAISAPCVHTSVS